MFKSEINNTSIRATEILASIKSEEKRGAFANRGKISSLKKHFDHLCGELTKAGVVFDPTDPSIQNLVERENRRRKIEIDNRKRAQGQITIIGLD